MRKAAKTTDLRPCRWTLVTLIAFTLAAYGCANAPSTLAPQGPGAERVAKLWWVIFGMGTAIYIAVMALLLVALIRRGSGSFDDRPGLNINTAFIIGGVMALLLRVQLMAPENTFLGPEAFNQLFTMHGTTMMFLFAVPVLEGLGVYIVPLLLGARDMPFPTLNAFGYWAYLFGGIFLFASFLGA